jgi:hypothetical protein
MKKNLLIIGFCFVTISYTFTQELGINVERFLTLKRGSIEKTTVDDKLIGRRYFVFTHHPSDQNYLRLYSQDYEEEYYFIDNKLYFFVTEKRLSESRWKSLLATYMNNYKDYIEQNALNRDGSWFEHYYGFTDGNVEYKVFINTPSQRWNNVFKFVNGEAMVSVIAKHYQYYKEYQNALDNRQSINNMINSLDISPLSDGLLRTGNFSTLKQQLQKFGYSYFGIYEMPWNNETIHFFRKNADGFEFEWQFTTDSDNKTIKPENIFNISADSGEYPDHVSKLIEFFNKINERLKIIPEIYFIEYSQDSLSPKVIYSGEKLYEILGLKSLEIHISSPDKQGQRKIWVEFKY